MAESPYIFEVTRENYAATVVENSFTAPVLVDYWAEWCGPCQMQLPVLLKLVDEYQGKLFLAKVNTEEQRQLAVEHGIRSIPTMKLYRNGEIVEEILGAQAESTLRNLINRYIERPSDKTRIAALKVWERGNTGEALAMLREAAAGDPDNHALLLDYARIAIKAGELEEAESALGSLPPDVRSEGDAAALQAEMEFARLTHDTPEPDTLEERIAANGDDCEARYQLAAHLVTRGEYEAAMDQYLEILQRERSFREDAARKGLLAVFNLLGNEGELVTRYRRRMFNLLH
jgi:putative thioredoxin